MTCPRAKRMLAPRLVSPILLVVANALCSPTELQSVSSSGSGSCRLRLQHHDPLSRVPAVLKQSTSCDRYYSAIAAGRLICL